MNLRPSGYEPDELPDCSTPRHGPGLDWCGRFAGPVAGVKRISASKSGSGAGRRLPAMWWPRHVFARPGSDLLSHALRRSTIGAEGLHGRVRDGIGCFPLAITTRPCKHMARPTRTGTAPIGGGRRRSPVRACTRTGPYGLGKVKAGADAIAAAPSASAEKGASHGKTICGTGRTRLSGATAAKRKTAFSAACEVFRPGLLQAGEGTSRSSD